MARVDSFDLIQSTGGGNKGFTQLNRIDQSPNPQDNYSMEVTDDPLQLEGFTHLLRGHPCYTPGKDLAIPLFRGPDR
jgi:hypothetical protein